jgi:galactokinase
MIPFEDAAMSFQQAYSAKPTVFAYAPGRINLIGEHIDYAGGCVLPVALDYGVTVAAGPGRAGRMRVHSDQYLDVGVAEFDPNQPPPPAYLAFAHALALGTRATGADIAVVSDLPVGRGWSSSAAFGVGVSAALLALEPGLNRFTPLALCQLCQRAETQALGVACGLMDQYAAIYGKYDAAVLFDTQLLKHEYIPLRLEQSELVLIDSGQPRLLADAGYNKRREELNQALDELRARLGPFVSFRDVETAKLLDAIPLLPPPLQARARHVVTEQQRVERFAACLREGDVIAMGQLLSASQSSLHDDYEVSTRELDALCELLDAQAGVYGSRLVGGGFGGSVLALAHHNAVEDKLVHAIAQYGDKFDLRASYEVAIPGDGATVQPEEAPAPVPLAKWLGGGGA